MTGHNVFKSTALALASCAWAAAQSATSSVDLPVGSGSASAVITSKASSASDPATSSYSAQFTIHSAADVGANLLPNVQNSSAVEAQNVCPGYKASGVKQDEHGFTASLALSGSPVRPLTKSSYPTAVELIQTVQSLWHRRGCIDLERCRPECRRPPMTTNVEDIS